MGTPSELAEVEVLTFDCYGTLVDWLGGIRAAIGAMGSLEGCDVEGLIEDRARAEAEIEAGPYRPYGEVLAASLREAARHQGRSPTEGELARFARSMEIWPPFEDSGPALERLAERYRLAILSNVERRVLASSVRALGVPFALCLTAEDVRSYKPSRGHFDEALRRLGVPRERVLHCAQSLFHDVEPACAMGWRTAWVNREREELPPPLEPLLVVPDLRALADSLLGRP